MCARCGTFLCMECATIASDAESYCLGCEAQLPGDVPWEQRGRIGGLEAARATAAAVLLSPGAFFRLVPRERSVWPTVLFGYAFTLLVDLVDLGRALFVWWTEPAHRIAFIDGFEQGAASIPELARHSELAWWMNEFAGPVASPVWYAAWLFASSVAWWIGLRLVCGPTSLREIVRGLSYTNVLAAFGLVTLWLTGPTAVFAMLALGLWGSVLQILAMTRLAGGEIVRAIGAFLVSLAVLSSLGCFACMAPAAVVSMSGL